MLKVEGKGYIYTAAEIDSVSGKPKPIKGFINALCCLPGRISVNIACLSPGAEPL